MEDQQKFEYLVKTLEPYLEKQQFALNDLGKQGWHVVGTYSEGSLVTFILERPLR